MKKIIDYTFAIEGGTNNTVEFFSNELVNNVKKLIELGWQPFGSLTINFGDYGIIYTQTMVKYEDEQ
jgi:hypothetical protein